MLKNIIKFLFFRFLQSKNLFLDFSYYKHPNQIKEFLKNKDEFLQRNELKKITYNLQQAKNHQFYNQLLKIYVPSWSFPKKAIFRGTGDGAGSLNAFRKVFIEDKYFHEKVYFTKQQSLQRVKYFQDFGLKYIHNQGWKTPAIRKIYTSKDLTITYSDFLFLKPIKKTNLEKKLISFSKTLLDISYQPKFQMEFENIPKKYKNFKTHPTFGNGQKAIKFIQENNLDIDKIEKKITKSHYVIMVHGDLHKTNIFEKNIIIDWDFFGYLPFGFDPAKIASNKLLAETFLDPFEWLKENYKNNFNEKEYKKFEINFTYFFFVFSFNIIKQNKYKNLQNDILEKLRDVF